MAVCWEFPAKPAHATAAPEPPAPELPATVTCALDAGGNSQRPSTSPATATAPVPPRAIRLSPGLAPFLADSARGFRDRRSQPVMTAQPSRSPSLARPAKMSRARTTVSWPAVLGGVLGPELMIVRQKLGGWAPRSRRNDGNAAVSVAAQQICGDRRQRKLIRLSRHPGRGLPGRLCKLPGNPTCPFVILVRSGNSDHFPAGFANGE